jgi:hypothetical protein
MLNKILKLSRALLLMTAVAVASEQPAKLDANLGAGDTRQQCVWNTGDSHKMHYPQLPDEDGWDVNATYPEVVADDWRCSDTGYVEDIHFWGSWRHDDIGEIAFFQVAIHSNIPEDPPNIPYSRPADDFLWAFDLPIEWADVVPIQLPTPMEGWYDPTTGEIYYNDHSWYFQYNFCLSDWIDENQMFYQQEGEIYWLEIMAVVIDPVNTKWGWKSSEDHFMDDAVWAETQFRDWQELYEPGSGGGEPIINQFWIGFDATGIPVSLTTGGTDYYDDGASLNGWYYYQNTGWWNIWFFDHPFDPERYKEIYISFAWFPTESPYYIEIAVNWSTPDWPPDLPPPIPPLAPNEEDLYIHREFLPVAEPGFYEFPITVPDYNPEWVSVDVMGMNVEISPGTGYIEHTCIGLPVSMDMAFVITTSSTYECGDADGSGAVDIDDVVYLINYIFAGGPPPNPLAAGDADCSGGVDIDDAVYIITYIFAGGPPPCDLDGDGIPDC